MLNVQDFQLFLTRIVCSIIACCLVSACAQINRYPEYPQRYAPVHLQSASSQVLADPDGKIHSVYPNPALDEIRRAIAHAEETYLSMQRHIDSRDKLINSLAIAAITLAGALAADAIIDYSKDFATIGVVAGLTSYSITEWLADPRNDNLYALGMKAIDCAIRAVTPLTGTANLVMPLEELNSAIGDLSAAKQGLLSLGLITTNPKLVQFLESRVESADALLTAAESAEKSGRRLEASIGKADVDLTNFVRSTHLKVVNKLIENAKGVSELRSQVAALVFKPSNFITYSDPSDFVFGGLEPTDASTQDVRGEFTFGSNKRSEYDRFFQLFDQDQFNEAFGRTKAATDRVRQIVDAVDYSQATRKALEQCGIEVPISTPPLKSDRARIVFERGMADPIELNVSGGSGEYGAAFAPPVPGLTVASKVALGPTFAVTATNKVKAGSYQIKITDTADKALLLVVKVNDPTPSATSSRLSGACTGSAVAMSTIQHRLQQFGFDPGPVDCICGSKTESAMRSFWIAGGWLMDPTAQTPSCKSLGNIELNLVIANSHITNTDARTPLGIKTLALENMLRQKLGGAAIRPNGILDAAERQLIIGCSFSPIPTMPELDTAITVVLDPAFGRGKR